MNLGYLVTILTVWNIIVFLLYGLDKFLATQKMWRISEKMLLSCAFFFGGIGALVGMQFFRHKTKHNNFKVIVPIAAIVTIILFAILVQRS